MSRGNFENTLAEYVTQYKVLSKTNKSHLFTAIHNNKNKLGKRNIENVNKR